MNISATAFFRQTLKRNATTEKLPSTAAFQMCNIFRVEVIIPAAFCFVLRVIRPILTYNTHWNPLRINSLCRVSDRVNKMNK